MAGDSRRIEKYNQRLSNIRYDKGRLDGVGWYLCPNGEPRNFLISGGSQPDERYEPLVPFFESLIGRVPIVVVHNQNSYIEAIVNQLWRQATSNGAAGGPLVIANAQNPVYEPFFGMSDIRVVACLRQLAMKLGYTVLPAFEKVARAHLAVLRELHIPNSLSGLYYLCQFSDMGQFHRNIMALPCGQAKANIIWADMDTGSDSAGGQLDLFRSVVLNLAGEAMQSGWKDDRQVAQVTGVRAIENNATLTLSVNDMNCDIFLSYLVEELKENNRSPYVLIIDGVHINDRMFDYLRTAGMGCRCGIVAENAIELTGGDTESFLRLAEKMGCFVLFKHSTGKTASVLSEVMGRYDSMKRETSQGSNRGLFKILPQGRHDDVRYSTENRYRVMPEEITGLGPGQAIVFDTQTDQIIHFNF